ncbi:ATP-dependent RNA helicase [Giardia muris]|uniref:ATP-dependent RNA helicase n=1 Tax=Giardia muris TaxID=5742 RepID=A0A4Z1T1Y8_GIAMU|nr:ATP-dependent RNA helicase [Giardia muris]|eukprot:TNJ27963.1 ATP-dependent RNA helicase [Giardia muris]
MEDLDYRAVGAFEDGRPTRPKSLGKRSASQFDSLDLAPPVRRGIRALGFSSMTPIQKEAIPAILEGGDVCIVSKTGSGKTAAYGIPLINILLSHKQTVGVRGVVIAPTRELCLQIATVLRKLAKYTDPALRICLLVGGEALDDQFSALAANPDIIVCTPGRFLHHAKLVDNFASLFRTVEYVCFDECDRMFEMGFLQQVGEILALLPSNRTAGRTIEATHSRSFLGYQIILVTATLSESLAHFSSARLQNPVIVHVEREHTLPRELTTQFLYCPTGHKEAALLYLCRDLFPRDWKVLIFVATKHHCDFLGSIFRANEIKCSELYGSLDQKQREAAVASLTAGRTNILISTDVAARGIDLPGLDCVVNYHFPCSGKVFVHRAGRSARAQRYGLCISLIEGDELPYCLDIMLHIGVSFHSCTIDDPGLLSFVEKSKELSKSLMTMECLVGRHATESVMQGLTSLLPSTLLDMIQSDIIKRHNLHGVEIQSSVKVATNAMKQVRSMRPDASSSSAARARNIIANNLIHEYPICIFSRIGSADLSVIRQHAESEHAMQYLASVLNSYRVATTQLEARVVESGGDAASTAMLKMRRLIEKKRMEKSLVQEELKKNQEEIVGASSAPKTRYFMTRTDLDAYTEVGKAALRTREQQNSFCVREMGAVEDKGKFLSAQTLTNEGAIAKPGKLESLITDFLPDDKDALNTILRKRHYERRWDARRGRYENVELKQFAPTISDEHLQKRYPSAERKAFNDSTGQWVSQEKVKDSYKRWKIKMNMRIASGGTQETITDKRAKELLMGQGLGRKRGAIIRSAQARGHLPIKTEPSKVNAAIEQTLRSKERIVKVRADKRIRQQKVRERSEAKGRARPEFRAARMRGKRVGRK